MSTPDEQPGTTGSGGGGLPPLTRRAALVSGAAAAMFGAAADPAVAEPERGAGSLVADLVLEGADVVTMEAARPRAQAIAVAGDRILAVGSRSEVMAYAGRGTRVVDVGGRMLIPGLVDGHTHAIRGGQTYDQETYWLDERRLSSALTGLRHAAGRLTGGRWAAVVGSWHPNQFEESRPPTLAEVDAVSSTTPVYVQFLYTYAMVNRAGIRALGLDDPGRPQVTGLVVERDADGRATGRLTGGIGPFNTLVAQILATDQAARTRSLEHYFRALNRSGVVGLIDDNAGPPSFYEPLFALADAGRLTLRAGYRIPAQAPGTEAAFFERVMEFRASRHPEGLTPFVGLGEIMSFGVNDGTRQAPGFEATADGLAQLRGALTLAATRGAPLEIHAYTDDAASQILDVVEEVDRTTPISGLRWAMAHLNTGQRATFARLRRLDMAFSVQMGPFFEAPDIVRTNGLRVARTSPARLALDEGLMVAGGTDATRVGDYRVWPALQYLVTGASAGGAVVRRRSQRLTRMEALRAYTYGSAWLAYGERDRGTLVAGKLADLAVLDRDYLQVDADEIGQIRADLTMVGGRVVHDRHGLVR